MCATAEEATALILSGRVVVNQQRVDKVGTLLPASAAVRVRASTNYVSRGGDKLERALAQFDPCPPALQQADVLDIGASTGGFTDYCLRAGARSITCVDVGRNQLAWKLRSDPRVSVHEKTDIRDYARTSTRRFGAVVGDVSFISWTALAAAVTRLCAPDATLIILVKPQFELPRTEIPPGGVVRCATAHRHATDRVAAEWQELGWTLRGQVPSPVLGRCGNQEFFLWLQRKDLPLGDLKEP